MDTKEFWEGEGGDEYTKRTRVDWRARIPFWKMILDGTGARSVFEFGCNAGYNLTAIQAHNGFYKSPEVYGSDVNNGALEQARMAGINAYLSDDDYNVLPCELAFTAGVLIHIPPEDLFRTMKKIISKSTDYILAVEYYAEEETEIEYRGENGLLWKRDYGKLYQDMGLSLTHHGNTEHRKAIGFDNCHWWLLRK